MRFAPSLLVLALAAACTPAEEPAPEAAMPAAPTHPHIPSTTNNTVTLTGVADPVPSTMTGTADGVWMMTLEGRDSIPVTASMSGDSLIAETAEYESILRPGVMVSVRTASVLHDNMWRGNVIATYKTDGDTETVTGTMTGTRPPM
jgi:hypothetical protein